MYRILNLPVGDYLRLYTYDDVPEYHYYWHESLITVNGSIGQSVVIELISREKAEQILELALAEYRRRRLMFGKSMAMDKIDYKECEFEIVVV